jgi:tetratricopeptide (TPR) repeat protein
MAEDALKTDQESGVKTLQGYALYQLAEVLDTQGDSAAAKGKFEESARVRHEIHETVTEAESQLALGHLQIEIHDAKAAEETARGVISVFQDAKSSDNAALSYSLLGIALCRQEKLSEAQQALHLSRNLLPKTVDVAVRLQVEMENALVAGMSNSVATGVRPSRNEVEHALKDLESVQEKARSFGYLGIELESRLRQGELELHAGNVGLAQAHLRSLQKDARAKGFVSIANQAAALQG